MRFRLFSTTLILLALTLGSRLTVDASESRPSPAIHAADEGELCLGCHDLEQGLESRVPHQPVAEGRCTACHNPHVARFSALLKDRPGPLCQTCHTKLQNEIASAFVHDPVKKGECSKCHKPHGSDHKGLLVESASTLCGSCHVEVESWMQESNLHGPFAQARCATCHEPHGGEHQGLLVNQASSLCSSCHSPGESFRSAHRSYPVEKSSCQQCHDPHSSSRKGLFRETSHPPFESGDCRACHASPDSAEPFAILESQDSLCGDCHEQQVFSSQVAAFPHVAGGSANCTACHNPHSGKGEAMLVSEPERVCLECHDPGGSSSGDQGRFGTHAEGKDSGSIECTVCHAAHGGYQPMLLTQDSIELCGSCHTHEHGVRHPLGDEIPDPRSGAPMTCLSCHSIHRGTDKMYLHASDEGDLCLSCHKDLAG